MADISYLQNNLPQHANEKPALPVPTLLTTELHLPSAPQPRSGSAACTVPPFTFFPPSVTLPARSPHLLLYGGETSRPFNASNSRFMPTGLLWIDERGFIRSTSYYEDVWAFYLDDELEPLRLLGKQDSAASSISSNVGQWELVHSGDGSRRAWMSCGIVPLPSSIAGGDPDTLFVAFGG